MSILEEISSILDKPCFLLKGFNFFKEMGLFTFSCDGRNLTFIDRSIVVSQIRDSLKIDISGDIALSDLHFSCPTSEDILRYLQSTQVFSISRGFILNRPFYNLPDDKVLPFFKNFADEVTLANNFLGMASIPLISLPKLHFFSNFEVEFLNNVLSTYTQDESLSKGITLFDGVPNLGFITFGFPNYLIYEYDNDQSPLSKISITCGGNSTGHLLTGPLDYVVFSEEKKKVLKFLSLKHIRDINPSLIDLSCYLECLKNIRSEQT